MALSENQKTTKALAVKHVCPHNAGATPRVVAAVLNLETRDDDPACMRGAKARRAGLNELSFDRRGDGIFEG
jgi:hypothetical protein